MGVIAYLSDMFITSEEIAQLEPGLQELYLSRSMFQKVVYGLGVGGGLLGSILLILRKNLVIFFFLVSLIGVALQFVYGLAFTNSYDVLGPFSLILPAIVILVAAFLFWYSRNCKAHGLI
jgi:hypothetical protein